MSVWTLDSATACRKSRDSSENAWDFCWPDSRTSRSSWNTSIRDVDEAQSASFRSSACPWESCMSEITCWTSPSTSRSVSYFWYFKPHGRDQIFLSAKIRSHNRELVVKFPSTPFSVYGLRYSVVVMRVAADADGTRILTVQNSVATCNILLVMFLFSVVQTSTMVSFHCGQGHQKPSRPCRKSTQRRTARTATQLKEAWWERNACWCTALVEWCATTCSWACTCARWKKTYLHPQNDLNDLSYVFCSYGLCAFWRSPAASGRDTGQPTATLGEKQRARRLAGGQHYTDVLCFQRQRPASCSDIAVQIEPLPTAGASESIGTFRKHGFLFSCVWL